jgi:hypothetical protein
MVEQKKAPRKGTVPSAHEYTDAELEQLVIAASDPKVQQVIGSLRNVLGPSSMRNRPNPQAIKGPGRNNLK